MKEEPKSDLVEIQNFYFKHQTSLQAGALGGYFIHVVRHAEQFVEWNRSPSDPTLLEVIRWYERKPTS